MFRIFLPIFLLTSVFITDPVLAQTDSGELIKPNYVNAKFGFGIALPDGFSGIDLESSGVFFVQILGDSDDPMGAVSIEKLPKGVTDVAGWWQAIKDRDPVMKRNITYERSTTVAETGAIQARVEKIDSGQYILSITWVFVHDGYGFTLSVQPSETQDIKAVRELGDRLSEQFRWMSEEEINEIKADQSDVPLPRGQEF